MYIVRRTLEVLMEPLSLFMANFIYIALKAFQQKNVMHDQYKLMVPTSCSMAICEYFITGTIALIAISGNGFVHTAVNVLSIGLGGGLGSVLATYYHHKIKEVFCAKA